MQPGICQDVKRGVGGGGVELANAANARWYYTWGNTPPAEIYAGELHGEFVPMIWSANAGTIQARVDNILGYAGPLGIDHVLGFNEPDRAEQANMSVATAISLWDVMDDQFANAGIELVSPALGDDAWGRAWMDDFINQASALNLTVDAVAMHWYGTPNIINPAATANGFLSRVDYWYNRYGKPIWITEFAGMDWGSDDISSEDLKAFNEAFLAVVVPGLESRSYVERYAWWQFGRRDVPGEEDDTSIIEQVGDIWTPTAIGDQYVPSYREGEQFDLSGATPNATNFYLRGGSLVNQSGPTSVTVAMVDVVNGDSEIGGAVDWDVATGGLRIRTNAIVRKTGSNRITLTGGSISNSGQLHLATGALVLEKGVTLQGTGVVDIAAAATLELGAATDRSGVNINQPIALDGGTLRSNHMLDGVHTINAAVTLASTSTFAGDGTVIVGGPLHSTGGSGIVKQGAGNLILAGTNTFSGDTVVDEGVLALVGTAHLDNSLRVDVQQQATLDVSGRTDGTFTVAGGRTLDVAGNVIGSTQTASGAVIAIGGDGAVVEQLQTVTVTPPLGSLGNSSDVRVRSGAAANVNQGDTVALGIGSINATEAFRSLLTFDLSSTGLTNSDHIESATLTMTLASPNGAQVNTPAPPVLELLTIGSYNSDTATFNNTPFTTGNLVANTTGPNFAEFAAGDQIQWFDSESGNFVAAVQNAIGGSLHLGARVANTVSTRSFYFVQSAETSVSGAAPSLTITYTDPTNPVVTGVGSGLFEGDLTLAAGASLEIDLFDSTLHDQLTVHGAAALSGTLSINLLDPSQVNINDTFTILTANSIVNNLTLGGPSGNLFSLAASTSTELVLTYVGLVGLPGDFNGDDVVDAADYTVWRDNQGSTEGTLLGGNGTGGLVDQADYDLWRANFGAIAAPATLAAAVPEPQAGLVVLVVTLLAWNIGRRQFDDC